jgi:hypothetical protein
LSDDGGSSVNSYNMFGLPQEDEDCLAAVYHLRDIDSFIANVTVPPPPKSYLVNDNVKGMYKDQSISELSQVELS